MSRLGRAPGRGARTPTDDRRPFAPGAGSRRPRRICRRVRRARRDEPRSTRDLRRRPRTTTGGTRGSPLAEGATGAETGVTAFGLARAYRLEAACAHRVARL